jgi:RNA polymerase sigma factor (sigma-70 family)
MTRAEFSQFVRAEYDRITRFVRSRIPNTADAEDLVQKTLLKLFVQCDGIDAARPAGFVFTTLRHAITDYWRASVRRPRPSELPEHIGGLDSSHLFPPDALTLEQRCRDALRHALAELTPRERQAFAAYWQTAGDRGEALIQLGLTDKDKNERSRGYDQPVHHARKKMGLALAPHWDVLRGLSFHRTWELVSEELGRPTTETVA